MDPKPPWLTEEEFDETSGFDWNSIHDYVHVDDIEDDDDPDDSSAVAQEGDR